MSSSAVGQVSPTRAVMRFESLGLARTSHRRGVMPLVLFVNLSGQYSAKSGKRLERTSWLWIAATPFTLWLPATARLAIRMCLSCPR